MISLHPFKYEFQKKIIIFTSSSFFLLLPLFTNTNPFERVSIRLVRLVISLVEIQSLESFVKFLE